MDAEEAGSVDAVEVGGRSDDVDAMEEDGRSDEEVDWVDKVFEPTVVKATPLLSPSPNKKV